MPNLIQLLYQALASPRGLVLQTSNFTLARQRFYQARAKAGEPAFAKLQFRQGPDEQLWIIRSEDS